MAAKKIRNEASSSGGNNRGESVVVDVGRNRSPCGYCRSGGPTSISQGLWAHSLTVDDYQALLDRGWRRSGSFLYKPEMERTCCPSYTIRLKASDFVHSKEQLRVSKRMQRWVPFDIARPLLDRKTYVVLSDFTTSQNVDSSTPVVLEDHIELQLDDPGQEDSNDIPIDEDEEMEHDFEDSDDESGPETSGCQ
uniref:Putative Acyl-CoA N-acyltransferase n=1 Tax=Davidia involucrata TaxID=16924 RepID=A0A5B7AR46_DAVIN